MRLILTLLLSVLVSTAAAAGETRIAVAANFTTTAKMIGTAFERASGHKPIFSFGSTGQLYAQISQGAPYDVFLSADRLRAERAVTEGFAVPGSRFAYATGRIVLFSRDKGFVHGNETLTNVGKIAIANPKTAPYGAAAVETMKALGVYERLEANLVRGNNIAQTYQFVYTGNAELGFVALSQVADHDEGSRWIVPDRLHSPITQDAVLLKRGAENAAAWAFLSFLKGPEARAIIEKHGYDGP